MNAFGLLAPFVLAGVLATPARAAGAPYVAGFAAPQNPIGADGSWVNGKAVGLDWNDVQVSDGHAHAAAFVAARRPGRYADPIAHLTTVFGPDQYAQATVFRSKGYKNPKDKHEVELLLRFRITPHQARGYEVLWGQDGGICVVRWNGPVGDYTQLGNCTADAPASEAVDGDTLRAEIAGNVITVLRNGQAVITAVDPDARWKDGQPGMGFWPTPGSDLKAYGWKEFRAGGL